jgi:large subunit ribosomal protein L24
MKKAKLKVKKGDQVIVLTGKDKGKKGEVMKVFPTEMKVLVTGVAIAKKHMKPSRVNPNGGIVSFEKPIHYSNVAIVDPKVGLPTKVGYKILEDGKKVRFARRSKEMIDNR